MSLNGDREAVEKVVDAALASLEANRARIDDLNVYPVPDGDTGTNLTMTMRAVADAVDHTSAASRQSLARDVARGALMGARGNSGVIFSQIVRGAADVLGETDAPAIDADALARALRGATRRRLPRGAAAGRGDDAVRHPRARRGGRGPAPATAAARRPARRARPPRRGRARAHARAASGAEGRGCRRRRRRRARRARARRRGGGHAASRYPSRRRPRSTSASRRSTRSCRATSTAPSS